METFTRPSKPGSPAFLAEVFCWNDHFNTGLPEIDHQHRRLVELLNLFAAQVATDLSLDRAKAVYADLVAYALSHFAAEEAMMNRYFPDAPEAEEHKVLHQRFAEALKSHETGLNEEGGLTRIDAALSSLTYWLVEHILRSDRHMGHLVHAIKAGETLESARQIAARQMHEDGETLINIILTEHSQLGSNALRLMREMMTLQRTEVALKEAWRQTESANMALEKAMLEEIERRMSIEIKGRVAAALMADAESPFPDRVERALAELSRLPGLHPEGGLWFRGPVLQSLGILDGWVGHGARIWQRPLPKLAAGAIDIISRCTHTPDVEHGHYFVSTAHYGEEIGLLVFDTIANPPSDAIRLDLLKQLGELFALAVHNEYARLAHEQAHEQAQAVAEARRELEMLRERERLAAQAMSQARLATLGEMATGMMHEINQPLTFISATLQAMRRAQRKGKVLPEEKVAELVEESLHQISRITRIMQYLRDFGRGNEPEHLQPVSLHECLEHTLAMLGKRMEVANIRIQRESDPHLPTVWGDEAEMEEVLANLLINAQEAMTGQDNKQLRIALKKLGGMLQIQIEDNGHGMTDEVSAKCFEPFFTTREIGSGAVGVGLSTVHGIVTRHHGKISVTSTPGEGTTFTLWLPVAEEMA